MKETFYFPHDNNAHNDPKLMNVFMELGLSGIGMYWILIELLHQQENGKITKEQFTNYIKWYGSKEEKAIIEQLLSIYLANDLFCLTSDNFITSNRVLKNKEYRKDLSEKRSNAGKKGAQIMKSNIAQQANAKQNKANAKQLNKIKVNKIKNNIIIDKSIIEVEETSSSLQNIDKTKIIEKYNITEEELNNELELFINYWTEKNKAGKQRYEFQKTFDPNRRLTTWLSNNKKWNKKIINKNQGIGIVE